MGGSFHQQSFLNDLSSQIKFEYVDVDLTTLVRMRDGNHVRFANPILF